MKVQEKKKKGVVRVFPSWTKREIRHFHVVVVQRRLRNEQKNVMHVLSCCFANLNLLGFFWGMNFCVNVFDFLLSDMTWIGLVLSFEQVP